MKYEEFLTTAAQEINEELFEILENWKKTIQRSTPALNFLAEAFIEHCHGGKRLRGYLVKLGYLIAGGEALDKVLLAAAAFEIFQTSILIHDDIIDKSNLRRGKPSLYVGLGNNHYGMSQAISLADLGFFLSMELLSSSEFPAEVKNKALSFFSHVVQDTAKGEMLDMLLPTMKMWNESDVISLSQLKTASYSFVGPLSVGALLAGADEKMLQPIRLFGENLGIAYQIQDDIFGIFSDEKTLGKSHLSDIQEGKRTLLLWYAHQHATEQDKQFLQTLYGNPSATKTDSEKIKEIFVQTGAYDYALRKVGDYTEKARISIPTITSNPEMNEMLQELTVFLLERIK